MVFGHQAEYESPGDEFHCGRDCPNVEYAVQKGRTGLRKIKVEVAAIKDERDHHQALKREFGRAN